MNIEQLTILLAIPFGDLTPEKRINKLLSIYIIQRFVFAKISSKSTMKN
jgi:hypothetical protein